MKTFFIISFLLFAISVGAQVKAIKITELEKTIKESTTPMIVNFWATYCVPCIEEIPYFQDMAKKYKSKGVSLLLVSLDLKAAYPAKIDAMAKKLKLTAPIVWLNETNADYFCPKVDSSWSGGLPASLFVNNTAGYRKFYEDEVSKQTLENEIQAMMKPKQN
jgi:thiol-disulfide isomerase/thioredoxin